MMSRELSSSGTISSAPEHHHTTGNPDGRAHELRSEGLGGVRNGGVSVAEEMDFAPDESYIYLGAGGKRSNGGGGARYKSLSPARLPIAARSQPCLTIPPGLSPTSLLLESPVLLTNVKAEPSPTTGTFSIPSTMNDNVPSDTLSSPRDSCNNSTYDEGSSGDFEFKPYVRLCSTSGPLSMRTLDSASSKQQQIEPFAQDQSQCQSQAVVSSCLVKPENAVVSSHESTLSVKDPKPASEIVRSPSIAASSVSAPYEISSDVLQQAKDSENGMQASEVDHKENGPLVVIEKSSEDGYNWRKYGQKLVKGSEFPRSYYKCTHPNCQMKKHLERSRDGQITDIIYIGSHDHPKPQPSRRLAVGAILLSQGEERVNGFFGCAENNAQRPTSNNISLNGTPELCPASASDDDVECTGGQSSIPAGDIVDDDDPESKRRKKDDGSVDVLPMGKTREPRVVVQTLSEVDILDDGYRWRKYGQKVVKGNPNPRSYYKCTNAGCPVRKHVERASHDPKAVITTYEGKHNHDVPAARTSSSSSHDHTTSATVIVNDTAGSHLSGGTMNNSIMMRTCGTLKATSCQYERSEEEFDTISLDLGVGINSPRQDQRANNEKQQQTPEIIEQIHNSQMRLGAGSGCDRRRLVIQAVPISAGYVISPKNNNSIDCYGSTREVDKRGESFSFNAAPPLNHSSSTYQANTLEDCF